MDAVFQHTFDPVTHGLNPAVDTFEVTYQRLEPGLKKGVGGEVRYVFAAAGQEEGEEFGMTKRR